MAQAVAKKPTTDLTTPEVDIDLIRVVEGYNPRTRFDREELEALARDIEANGMIEPLVVLPPDEDGFLELRAGGRRMAAARKAGLERVPVNVKVGGSELTNAENYHRVDLDPVAQARAWQAVAEEHNLTTQKAIKERTNAKSVSEVGGHLRLLKLPEGVQRFFEEEVVPITAEPRLRDLCKVSPRIAECVCELARRDKVAPSNFVSRFPDLLEAVATAKIDDPPVMVPVPRASVSVAVSDPEKRKELVDRIVALYPKDRFAERGSFQFSQEEIDQARAAGCLVEYEPKGKERRMPARYITDGPLAADLAERAVTRIEGEVAKEREQQEERDREEKARRQGVDPDADEDQQKKERREKLDAGKQKKVDALVWNEDVGRLWLKSQGGRALKQRALPRWRVTAHLLVDAYPDIAPRGVRIALSQMREVETTHLKSTGEPRHKITYISPEDSRQWLHDRIDKVRNLEEGQELLALTMAAALVTDEDALTKAERTGPSGVWHARDGLAADIKALTPKVAAEK